MKRAIFHMDYFQGLTFSARATTYIDYDYFLHICYTSVKQFCVKQKSTKISVLEKGVLQYHDFHLKAIKSKSM